MISRLIGALLLTACGALGETESTTPSAPVSPTTDPVPTLTVSPKEPPTHTLRPPTVTALPTPVTYGALKHPILLYGVPVAESGVLGYRFRDAEGQQGELSGLTTTWPWMPLTEALSPDGQWLAYVSSHDGPPEDTFLALYNLMDGATTVQWPLIAETSSQDLLRVSESIAEQYRPEIQPVALDLRTFEQCVAGFSWSPNGRYLAYISQTPGPSPDVFIYDTETATSRRVTNDLRIACSVEWSPDGAWLLYSTIVPSNENPFVEFHRAPAEAQGVTEADTLLEGYWWSGLEWVGPHSYAVVGTSDGGPFHDLQILDLQAGTVTNVWPEPFERAAVDPMTGLIVVSTVEPDTNTGNGLFLISPGQATQRLAEGPFWSLWNWGESDPAFVANDGDRLMSVSASGLVSPLFDLPNQWVYVTNVEIAPDRTAMAVFNEGESGFYIVGAQGTELLSLDELRPTAVFWRPDASGLAYIEGNKLMSLETGSGGRSVIFDCANETSRCILDGRNVTWVR